MNAETSIVFRERSGAQGTPSKREFVFLHFFRRVRENMSVQVRFLLGPAGSGKTFRCLAEISAELNSAPDGPPLVLLAPKQATFQLERQLLEQLPGYTRLHILSFERLALFVLKELRVSPGKLISEEGRVMALRAILARERDKLRFFHGTVGLTGFAQQLSSELRQLQQNKLSPETLAGLAERPGLTRALRSKLHDLSLLLKAYLQWTGERELRDAESLLDTAAEALKAFRAKPDLSQGFEIAGLWLDGFAEFTPQELALLSAVVACCERSTLAFCVPRDQATKPGTSWLSIWSGISQTFRKCSSQLAAIPGAELSITELPDPGMPTRFSSNPVLARVECNWQPAKGCEQKFGVPPSGGQRPANHKEHTATPSQELLGLQWNRPSNDQNLLCPEPSAPEAVFQVIRLAMCDDVQTEAVLAVHEILRFVRGGGRFREAAILLRRLEGYHHVLRRVLSRYEIPFFLDRRESVAHHPLAELTRNALRTIAFGWRHDDWFGALKTGLVCDDENAIDAVENEALSRGWKGDAWVCPLPATQGGTNQFEAFRAKSVQPFLALKRALDAELRPTGEQLSGALQQFWGQLGVEETLATWTASEKEGSPHAPRRADQFHSTVWDRLNEWLADLSIAFSGEALSLKEWLPVLEAGLSGLTVGVIPPAIDQMLVGAIDRSRNPDLRLVIVLGANESVFPALPQVDGLLTEPEREELTCCGFSVGYNTRQLLSRERFFGYIACTRARERLVITCAKQDSQGKPLNPSPFVSHLQSLFPQGALEIEDYLPSAAWLDSEHSCELISRWKQLEQAGCGSELVSELASCLRNAAVHESLKNIELPKIEKLSNEVAHQLYGPVLKTSVSRLEQFAACPFKFFIDSGLRAEERKLFELDAREKGSFQHLVLAEFHAGLRAEKKRWHDLTPSEARRRIAELVPKLAPTYREGLFASDAHARFASRSIAQSLQEFVHTIVEWMRQYDFEPAEVEMKFGPEGGQLPGWELDLDSGHKLMFRGTIDRIDLCRIGDGEEALAVVVDYKSSARKLDALLMENGLQLQLPAYLSVLRRLPDPEKFFGVRGLIPAGVFYVNLNGQFKSGKTRTDVLGQLDKSRYAAYQHCGRFDFAALARLDNRGENTGTQFSFRLKKDGKPYANCSDVMTSAEFGAMLDRVETNLVEMGREIFAGNIAPDPYRKASECACDKCEFAPICRIDPWTHKFRVLRACSDGNQPIPAAQD